MEFKAESNLSKDWLIGFIEGRWYIPESNPGWKKSRRKRAWLKHRNKKSLINVYIKIIKYDNNNCIIWDEPLYKLKEFRIV